MTYDSATTAPRYQTFKPPTSTRDAQVVPDPDFELMRMKLRLEAETLRVQTVWVLGVVCKNRQNWQRFPVGTLRDCETIPVVIAHVRMTAER